MKNGIFTGTIKGFHSDVTVKAEINDGKIKVATEGITPYTVGQLGARRMVERINQAESVDVDAITGASFSSSAVLKAAMKAVEVAEGTMDETDALNPQVQPHKEVSIPQYAKPIGKRILANDVDFTDTYDVIVAGGGVSGLTAAITATEHGAKTVLFEKAGMVGGSANYSHGIIQASGTKWQKEFTKYQADNPEKHLAEIMQTGEGQVDPELVRIFTENAADSINWLADLGLKWKKVYGHKTIPYQKADNFAERIHSYEHGGFNGAGSVMITKMLDRAIELGVEIVYDSPVVGLVSNDQTGKEVVGALVNHNSETKAYRATKGVVLATASIDHNEELAKSLDPWHYRDIKRHVLMTSKHDTGDGIVMGMTQGAKLASVAGAMDVDMKFLSGLSTEVQAFPMFNVNARGKRYVNEETTYGFLSRANYEQERNYDAPTWLVFGENSLGQTTMPYQTAEDAEVDIAKGFVVKAVTIEELAKKMQVDGSSLKRTLNEWNEDAKAGVDHAFGRTEGLAPLQAAYYAYSNRDVNIGSIGGLKVNSQLEVLGTDDAPIAGLYAIGLNAGGWIGNYYPGSGTALGGSSAQGRFIGKKLASN